MSSTITENQVVAKLGRDDAFVVNCLIKLYERQTADERMEKRTAVDNGVGFNAVDAAFLSSCAEQATANRRNRRYPNDLSPAQLNAVRRSIVKYARQITDMVNEAMASRVASPARTVSANPDGLNDVQEAALARCVASMRLHEKEELAFRNDVRASRGMGEWRGNDVESRERAEKGVSAIPGRTAGRCLSQAARAALAMMPSDEEQWQDAAEHRLNEEELGCREFETSPSCRIIVEGNVWRFPTARELWRDGGKREFDAEMDRSKKSKSSVWADVDEEENSHYGYDDPFDFGYEGGGDNEDDLT